MSQRVAVLLMAASVACGGSRTDSPAPAPKTPAVPFQPALFAGEPVSVLPLTLVVPDTSLARGELFREQERLLRWADSIVEARLAARAPEVDWIFPEALRRVARRAPGIVTDPDRLGQAVMRAEELTIVPDPFRTNLRSLVAVAGGRYAFIPASVFFDQPQPGVVEAYAMIVAADSRTGNVVWRSLARGRGGTPGDALALALDDTFPLGAVAP